MKRTAILVWFFAVVGAGPNALAWGPHPNITRAAQEVLPQREKAAAYFGSEWKRLHDLYCGMPDFLARTFNDFFPDDYLIFPDVPRYLSHSAPDVSRAYVLFFRRALQALRTESPQNAARWLGSLVHFVEDSGAPPHAAAISSGELHKRLENWLDSKAVSIAGYTPRLLGRDERTAQVAFLKRMDDLVAYAKTRAEKIRDHVESLPSREDQPLILECANESARVCADVMHTLFTIAPLEAPWKPTLAGTVKWPADAPLPGHPAKVILLGTPFSTLTDTNGVWGFRNVPVGRHQIAVSRVGAGTVIGRNSSVTLPPTAPPGNLIRNPDFKLCWVTNGVPDHWRAITGQKELKGWWSDNIRINSNLVYRVGVAGAQSDVKLGVWWRPGPNERASSTNVVWSPETAERELQPMKTATYAQVLVVTDKPLTNAVRRVWLVPEDEH